MSYIGNSPSQTAFLTDQFSGTGSQTAFTMSVAPANTASCIVAVSGVLQDPSTYSVVGTTLNFTVAPPAGSGNISVRYLGIPASGVTTTAYRTATEFTATSGQTTFTPPSYTVGYLDVYRNGALLGSADYTATNGTTVVLAVGAVAGDLIETISFYVSSVLNAIPNTTGSISSSNLPAGLTLTTPTINSPTLVTPALGTPSSGTLTNCTGYPASALPAGSVVQVVQGTYATQTSSSTSTYADTGLTATITPGSSSNKILVLITHPECFKTSANAANRIRMMLVKNGSNLVQITEDIGWTNAATSNTFGISFSYLDSPASTSALTYKTQFANPVNTAAVYVQYNNMTSAITLIEIKA